MQVITICGNIGQEPVQKTSERGNPYIEFSIGVNTGKGDNRLTSWYTVRYPNVNVLSYLSRGKKVTVIGQLSIKPFIKQDNTPGVFLDVYAQNLDLGQKTPDIPQY